MFYLGLLISTSLYGIFCFLFTTIALHVSPGLILKSAFHLSSFLDIFYGYMMWSIPAFIALVIIHYLLVQAREFEHPSGARFLDDNDDLFSYLLADISNPIRGLSEPFTMLAVHRDGLDDGSLLEKIFDYLESIIHFIWAIALILFIIFGFISVFRTL